MFTPLPRRSVLLVGLFATSCALTGVLLAQPSLRITLPADGTIVHPGESLTVTVDVSPPEGLFEMVLVNATTPLGAGKQALKAPPYQFTVQVPSGISPNRYTLTALGITSSKEFVYSHPVDILVERSDSPVSITVYPTVADLTLDQKRYLQVTGRYADGNIADLTQSNRISYVSSAAAVATVQAQGIVSPVAPGSAKIIISYGNLKLEVPVTVRGGRR